MNTLHIISDQNILKFKETKVVGKVTMLVYEYVESKSKKGELLFLTQGDLDNMVRKDICKVLN